MVDKTEMEIKGEEKDVEAERENRASRQEYLGELRRLHGGSSGECRSSWRPLSFGRKPTDAPKITENLREKMVLQGQEITFFYYNKRRRHR